jgi:hypothetical protein
MLDRDQCLQFAEQDEQMAAVSPEPEHSARLLDMAAGWRKLADMAEPQRRKLS